MGSGDVSGEEAELVVLGEQPIDGARQGVAQFFLTLERVVEGDDAARTGVPAPGLSLSVREKVARGVPAPSRRAPVATVLPPRMRRAMASPLFQMQGQLSPSPPAIESRSSPSEA